MNSFQQYFSKKSKNQSWLKTFLEKIAKSNFEEYFRSADQGNQGKSPVVQFTEGHQLTLAREIRNYKKQNEVKKKLFISFSSRREDNCVGLQEVFETYEEKYGKVLFPKRMDSYYEALLEMASISVYDLKADLYYEIREKIKKAYYEEFRSFLLQTLKSINRHFDHELKQACALFNEDKRSKFRSLCGFNLKSLDDSDSSEINTDNYSINLKQNHNEQGIYRWAG